MRNKIKMILAISIIILGIFAGCIESNNDADISSSEDFRTITDMRGIEVNIPFNLTRVVDLSDGFTAGIMTILGEQDKIVGLGSHCPQKSYTYTFETVSGENYSYEDGMNPVLYLNPEFEDLPILTTYGQATNYETLASLEPDIVILRVGSCYADDNSGDETVLQQKIDTIESLGIPLIVLEGPPCFDEPSVSGLNEEIRIVGEIFGKEDRATELANYLESIIDMIEERTENISADDKPNVLMFGLSPKAREGGGAGTAHGVDTIESYFLEEIVNAKNAFDGMGSFSVLSTEQVLALDPDVIILPTAWGYHPPSEVYTAPYYQNLQELDAVKNRNVFSLPWTPCNCAKRIEYPIEVMIMAKACYPALFNDIIIHEWVLEFYQNVYDVDEETAQGLRSTQWLDWTVDEDW